MVSTKGNTYQFAAQGATEYDYWSTNEGRAGGNESFKRRNAIVVHPNLFSSGRAGGKGSSWECHSARKNFISQNPKERLRAISKCMSRELRHIDHEMMQKDGFMPLSELLITPAMVDLFATREDVRKVIRGCGGNNKMRFEMGLMKDQKTTAIRACQGHSTSSGVADDSLPIAEGLTTLIHGTTYKAARKIVQEGISKMGRLHVHFYESDLEGRPLPIHPKVHLTSEVIVVVSAEKCERFGLVFHRASNGVILTNGGDDGYVPPESVLCVRQLPEYNVLWSAMSWTWRSLLGQETDVPAVSSGLGDKRPRQIEENGNISEHPTEHAASAQSPIPTDDEEEKEFAEIDPKGQKELKNKRKKARWTRDNVDSAGKTPLPSSGGASPLTGNSDGRHKSVSSVREKDMDNLKKRRKSQEVVLPTQETNVIQSMVISGANDDEGYSIITREVNSRTDVVITQEPYTRTVDESNDDVGSQSEDENITATCYPATPTSSTHSEKCAIYTDVSSVPADQRDRASSSWQLGQPYYRDFTFVTVLPERSNGGSTMNPPPGIAGSIDNVYQSVNMYQHPMSEFQNGTGNAMSDPRWMSPRYGNEGYGSSIPNVNWLTPPSSRNSGTSSSNEGQSSHHSGNHMGNSCRMAGGEWVPFLPKPTAKKAAQQLRQEQAHGERVQNVADARRLWDRLEEQDPDGPEDPEEGFSTIVVRYARYGREYVKKALEQTTAKAWQWWRGIRRAHVKNGGNELDLYEEYDEAVRQYKGVMARRMQ